MNQCTNTEIRHAGPAGGSQHRPGLDLLQVGMIRRLVGSPAFPYALQAATLVAFLGLAWYGWGRFAPEGVPAKLYAQTNLVNLLIWGLWWPAVVWLTVLLGRVWCMVCPLELVASQAESWARRTGLKGRPLPRWMRHGWLMLALYAGIQLLVPGIQINRVPAYTSVFMFALLGLAVLAALGWRDRAFCRGFCPVGLLVRVYGRGGMLAVRPTEHHTAQPCPAAEGAAAPASKGAAAGQTAPSPCPSLLNPARLDRSNDCLMCCTCVKAMPPGSMGLYLRPPFSPADSREPLATWPVALFVMLVSGFVTSELCSEWPAAHAAFQWVPQHVAEAAGLGRWQGWIEGLWTLGVVPAVVWSVLAGLTIAAGAARQLGQALKRLALPLAVLVAAGHLSKGLAKGLSWAGFLPGALADPSGTSTAIAIHQKTLAAVRPLVPMPMVSAAALGLVILGTILALREFRLAGNERPQRFTLPTLVLAAFFAFLVAGWGLRG